MPKLQRPPGHHAVVPSFLVPGAGKVIAFLKRAFGAKLVDHYDLPDGSIAHAELLIGDSVIMCGDPELGAEARPACLSIYVDDGPAVDASYHRALDAGATSLNEPADQFYGYRTATVKDGGGNRWTIMAIVEKVSSEEAHRRAANELR